MRELQTNAISQAVAAAVQTANYQLPPDVSAALAAAAERETNRIARGILASLVENAHLAERESMAICQDTGLTVVFAEVGQDLHLVGGTLQEAVDAGVREGYRSGYLRKSVIRDPLRRDTNTGDNTPAIVHVRLAPGDGLRLHVAPKGGGSENMSALWMMVPSEGREGLVRRVVARIIEAGGKPCPPLILGLGIGGNFETSALLAKHALLRPLGEPSPDPDLANLEREILAAVNATGVGPMGLGGDTTALGVHIERHPCHIASLPVALNVQCHAARHVTVEL
jgi:fumarate hydratase subunit alpha